MTATAPTPQLQLSQVTLGYDDTPVVEAVDLTLEKGQIGCLLGSSGCGKSTLLRAIAGFEPLWEGSIHMNGDLVSSTRALLPPEQRRVGMVFQDLALFPHLSVAENISFGLKDWSKRDRAARVKELLELIGLPDMTNRYPHALSGGQQQRVALARALAPRPQLLLMDEPFSGLDAAMREQLVPEVRHILLQEHMSALMVTHDQNEAFVMADKVALMHSGEIVQYDTAYQMYHKPANRYVADFIGKGVFLSGIIVDEKRVQSALGILVNDTPHGLAINQPVDILVRPDDLLHDDDSEAKAIIVNKQFRGSHFLYRVLLASQQELYCFASSHHNHALGEAIGVKLDLDHLVMFPQTDSLSHEPVNDPPPPQPAKPDSEAS